MKDERLKGIYVRRCKCGERPQSDREISVWSWWINCECGCQARSGDSLQEAVDNWNKGDFTTYHGQKDSDHETLMWLYPNYPDPSD